MWKEKLGIALKKYIGQFENVMIRVEEKRFKYIIICLIVYRIVLELFYVWAISPIYTYAGLVNQAKGWKYIFSWCMYFYMMIILPKRQEGTKEWFLHLQFALTIAPLIVFYAFANKSTAYLLMVIFVVSIETYILCKQDKTQIGINVGGLQAYTTAFLWIFIIGIFVVLLLYGDIHGLKAFNLNYLYEIRKAASYPHILEYFIGWMTSAIIPFFILFYLERKKYIPVIALSVITILRYMILGNKSIYFSLFVIFSVYIVKQFKNLILGMYLGLSAIASTFLCMFIVERAKDLSGITGIGIALMGERFLFVPAQNKFLYYECFSEFPKVGFSDGLIGKCFGLSYPYRGSMGQTIFAYLKHGRLFESNSNTGYLGDSYGQAGFLGMLITGILLALFIKLVCNIGQNLSEGIICPLLALLAVILNDGAFISVFLSSGWLVLVLLLTIYAKPKDKIYKRSQL